MIKKNRKKSKED